MVAGPRNQILYLVSTGCANLTNWLGDSRPNFLARISEFLYAQSYASSVKGTWFNTGATFAIQRCLGASLMTLG
jgi:hypothetical protein